MPFGQGPWASDLGPRRALLKSEARRLRPSLRSAYCFVRWPALSWLADGALSVGAVTVSTGGVTCHSGVSVPCTAPPDLTSAVATNAERPLSRSRRVNVPSLPLTLNVVPLGARPTTSAASFAVSRRGAPSRATV